MNTERFLDVRCVNLVQADPSGPAPGGHPVPVTPLTVLRVPDGGHPVGNLQRRWGPPTPGTIGAAAGDRPAGVLDRRREDE